MSAPRPTRLELENFRGVRRAQHDLSQLTLFIGANGAGKSSTLNAIEWCLFGNLVAKRGSGIAERSDWEVHTRGAQGDVVVTLEFEAGASTLRLTRRRAADARANDVDALQLEGATDETLIGYQAEQWLARAGFPDWDTWRLSFCQHQENVRARLTHVGDRSLQLGRLLGLAPYQDFNAALKDAKPRELAKTAKLELEAIADELERATERPLRELRELENELASRGIERTELSATLFDRRGRELLARAHALAEELACEHDLPATNGEIDHLDWIKTWGSELQELRRGYERERSDALAKNARLSAALQGIEPAERRAKDAQRALDTWLRDNGDEQALDAQLADLERTRAALVDEERGRDATLALLRQALAETKRRALGDECPVCNTQSAGLEAKLVESVGNAGQSELAEKRDALDARAQRLREQLSEVASLRNDYESAKTQRDRLAEQLHAFVADEGSEALAGARKQEAQLKQRSGELEDWLAKVGSAVDELRAGHGELSLIARWQRARARAETSTRGLDDVPAWRELQDTIDTAAGLACDLDFLAKLARSAQEERSAERVEAVNATLGEHFQRITGEREDGVQVDVKSTASTLTYRLVDARGHDLAPVLNQAALNALSLAFLFAQAEERARNDLPAWLVLDDPSQNLDERHERGLGDALTRIATKLPVIVATYSTELARELDDAAGARVLLDAATGVTA